MGKIHVYCGDGKGKTTAAIGLAIRAMGNRFRVIFVQFLKGTPTGELSDCKKTNQELFDKAIAEELGNKTLLILDEAVGALDVGTLEEELVIQFL